MQVLAWMALLVDHLPRENKTRVLALLPEVLRFKVDLRAAISLFRGEEFVRARASSGEDFLFVMIQSTDTLHRMQMLPFLERIAVHLQFRFGLDINHADLRLSLAGNEFIPMASSVLDLVFVVPLVLHFHPSLLTLSRLGERLL